MSDRRPIIPAMDPSGPPSGLSMHDAALIERDGALPGLRTLLTPTLLTRALQQQSRERAGEVFEPNYIRYKPGMNCLVGYNLNAGDSAHWVYAKAFAEHDRFKLDKVLKRQAAPGSKGRPQTVLEEENILLAFFPNDLKLPVLQRLDGGEAQRRLVERIFSDHPALWTGDIIPFRYKPERRLVARLALNGQNQAVIKVHTDISYARLRNASTSFKSHDWLRVPRKIGRSDRHRIIAFEWLPGELLRESLFRQTASIDDLFTVGRALVRIHTQNPDRLPNSNQEMETQHLLSLARQVALLYPELALPLKNTASRLSRRLLAAPWERAPVHGDFYAGQILLHDGRAAVLDFDESAFGNPMVDLGNFIAHLERDHACYGLPRSQVDRYTEAFLQGYASRRSLPSRKAIDLFTAVRLFKLLPHSFRFCEPGWPERTEALLRRIQSLIDHANRAFFYTGSGCVASRILEVVPEPTLPGPSSQAVLDPAMPYLDEVLTPARIIEPLREMLHEVDGNTSLLDVDAIRLQRHKPGRRALIEFDVRIQKGVNPAVDHTLLGKIRARGLDKTTYRLMQTMWQGAFNEKHGDGLYVPRPSGVLPKYRLWIQKKIDGVTATQLLDQPEGIQATRQAAHALHKLNRKGPIPDRCHTMEDELVILQDRLQRAATRYPNLADRILDVLDGCLTLAASLKPAARCPIHRDYYPDNVLIADNGLYLLDLDLYCLGDPALDAGNFLGHIAEYSLRMFDDPGRLRPCEEAFEEAFVALSGESIRRSTGIYKTLTLARHIHISSLFPDRRPCTEAILDLCEQRLHDQSTSDPP